MPKTFIVILLSLFFLNIPGISRSPKSVFCWKIPDFPLLGAAYFGTKIRTVVVCMLDGLIRFPVLNNVVQVFLTNIFGGAVCEPSLTRSRPVQNFETNIFGGQYVNPV
jgi:hypothetical protein